VGPGGPETERLTPSRRISLRNNGAMILTVTSGDPETASVPPGQAAPS
jgi:hypothetical protein